MANKLMGIVKWFSATKGFGFLNSPDEARDIFVHYSSVQMDGYRVLKEGQEVEFELEVGPKGPTAVNVKPLPAVRK